MAAGILADSFDVAYQPSGRRRKVLAGSSPVLLLRVPQKLKDEIHAEASRRDTNANDVILAALTDGLGIPRVSNRKDTMAETNGHVEPPKPVPAPKVEPPPPPGFLARASEYGQAATIPRLLALVTEKHPGGWP